MNQQLIVTLAVAFVPAILTGIVSFLLARVNFQNEIRKIQVPLLYQQEGQVATLYQRYISPLGFFATTLRDRFVEIENKFKGNTYHQVQKWFKEVKDHADNSRRRDDFPVWCCYEGIFVMTTLYYTCSYFQCMREIRYSLPFNEIDREYETQLEQHLVKVSGAFAWGESGIWPPIQDVIGERFTRGEVKIGFEELCKLMDSQDKFKYAPFFRPIDVYINDLNHQRAENIRMALDELVTFLNTKAPKPKKAVLVV